MLSSKNLDWETNPIYNIALPKKKKKEKKKPNEACKTCNLKELG